MEYQVNGHVLLNHSSTTQISQIILGWTFDVINVNNNICTVSLCKVFFRHILCFSTYKYQMSINTIQYNVIDSDRASSISVISSVHPENSIIPTSGGISSSVFTTGQLTQPLTRVADIQTSATGGDVAEKTSIQSRRVSTVTESLPVEDVAEQFSAHEEEEFGDDPLHCEDPVMHISGTGHWFLEGWIGDHSVEFLVDSGSSVTAISDVLYGNLLQAGAPVGALQVTARTLRSANGTGIEVLGCSRCSVSFLGLRTEFPIIICSLAAGTDAIIGTDVLGSVLPHTLDIKNGLLFTQGGASLQLHRRDSALSGRVFTVGHSSIPPYSEAVLHCSVRTTGGRALPSSGLLEGLTLFVEETGLIVEEPWSTPLDGRFLSWCQISARKPSW